MRSFPNFQRSKLMPFFPPTSFLQLFSHRKWRWRRRRQKEGKRGNLCKEEIGRCNSREPTHKHSFPLSFANPNSILCGGVVEAGKKKRRIDCVLSRMQWARQQIGSCEGEAKGGGVKASVPFLSIPTLPSTYCVQTNPLKKKSLHEEKVERKKVCCQISG